MSAVIKEISPNDFLSWGAFQQYRSPNPLDDFTWFTLSIGPECEEGADLFQVAVATPKAVNRCKLQASDTRFHGLTVATFDADTIERALKDYVAQFSGLTWHDAVSELRKRMLWEYEGMAGT